MATIYNKVTRGYWPDYDLESIGNELDGIENIKPTDWDLTRDFKDDDPENHTDYRNVIIADRQIWPDYPDVDVDNWGFVLQEQL